MALLFLAALAVALAVPARGLVESDPRLAALGALADSLMEAGAYARAESLAAQGLALARTATARTAQGRGAGELDPWLLRVGLLRLELGRYDEAEALLGEALAVVAATGGPDARGRALRVWRGLLRSRMEQGEELPGARAAAESCLALSREAHGQEDPRVAADLARLASVAIAEDRVAEASTLIDEAARLAEGRPGPSDEDLAVVLETRGALAREKGEYGEAAALLERSAALLEAQRGPDHPAVAAALGGLADVKQRQGDLVEAERLLRRSLATEERALGPGHPRIAGSLNSLGVVLRRKGDYAGAVQAYQRALAIQTAALGQDHPEVALTMVNLSAPLEACGDQAEALRLLRRAVKIMEDAHGPGHTLTAWALSHLAQTERGRGNARDAEGLFRRCLGIAEAAYGPHHPDVASYQLGIAQCLADEGKLEEAREFFEQAAATAAAVLGPDNHEVARYERELGVVLLLLGKAEEARAVLVKSAATLEAQLGPDHPALVRCLAGLASASLMAGKVSEARAYADRRLEVAERAFGEMGLRGSLIEEVAVEVAARRWDVAAAHAIRAVRIALATQEDIFQVSSEREALLYAGHHRQVVGALLAVLAAMPDPPDTTLAAAFSLVARAHGQVLDRLARRRQILDLAADSSAAGKLYAAYAGAAERLANRTVQGPGGNPERFRAEIARARLAKEEAERALAEASERFAPPAAARGLESELVPETMAERLAPGRALVQFVRFPRFTIGTRDWRPGATSLTANLFAGGGERYGAFLLRAAAGTWSLRFVDLGAAASLDSLIRGCRQAIDAPGAGSRPTAREEAEYRAAARRLYERLWAPLVGGEGEGGAGEGGEVPLVFLVPTSWLHLVDFNTLLSPEGRLVIEDWKVHLVASARDLFRSTAGVSRPAGRGLLAVGNPAGDPDVAFCQESRPPAGPLPLPGAELEAKEVGGLFAQATGEEATVLLGSDAAEGTVKRRMAGRRVLHLATHGFFCEDPGGGAVGEEVGLNPLVLSGLILAPGPGDEDGLLTAQEIVACDLRDLDWVLLSACNSGLGPVVPGEGLFGLRRAFEIAGARTVLMALWRIGDTTARDLVTEVYRQRLAGRSAVDALRLAELERLAEGRRRFHRLHPALWGGIVAEGDWR